MTARELRALGARIRVLEAYALGRRAGYLNLGSGRLEGLIRRLEEELRRGRADRRLDLLVRPGDVDAVDQAGGLEPSRDDLVDAFRREARARIGRRDGEPASVRNALRRAALELDRELDEEADDVEGSCSIELGLLGLGLELETIRGRARHAHRVTA
jgi:hypothetical protein